MRSMIGAMLKVATVAFLAVGLAIFISACGGPSNGGDSVATSGDSGDAAVEHFEEDSEGEAADDQEGGSTVHVALNEWSITGADDETDSLTAAAGEVVFEIHNDGAAPHNLFIVSTDLAPDALPITDGVVDMEAAGEVIGAVDDFPGGEIRVETLQLEPGNYVLLCAIPGHYQQGMHAGLTVE